MDRWAEMKARHFSIYTNTHTHELIVWIEGTREEEAAGECVYEHWIAIMESQKRK